MNKRNLIIAGSVLAVLGVGYLVYKKFFAQAGITKQQKEDLNIEIVRTDA
jgi:hypothetical protein